MRRLCNAAQAFAACLSTTPLKVNEEIPDQKVYIKSNRTTKIEKME
jgi:hypothetical protein